MDNLSENNAKVSDSGYSNSLNSNSRRSRSSKSTNSGSTSSGSSGYGGKPTTTASSSSNNDQEKSSEDRPKEKEAKKMKTVECENTVVEELKEEDAAVGEVDHDIKNEDVQPVISSPPPSQTHMDEDAETIIEVMDMDSTKARTEVVSLLTPSTVTQLLPALTAKPYIPISSDGFWCVVSMNNGLVEYVTQSITTALGYPKDMWFGRSFIDILHPKDRNTLYTQISKYLAAPKHSKVNNAKVSGELVTSMFCRLRRYRGLGAGFGVLKKTVTFMPFLLTLTFKSFKDESESTVYLVIHATPYASYFKVPNEVVTKAPPFVLRHSAQGILEYVSPESVQFLGYLPQELMDSDAFKLYHPDDLPYLNTVYAAILKEGVVPRSAPYRMLSQNGHYIKLETQWSCFINPWSRKLEFVTGKHYSIEGPENPDVFQTPDPEKVPKLTEDQLKQAQAWRESIQKIVNELLAKPVDVAVKEINKRFTTFLEGLVADEKNAEEQLQVVMHDADVNLLEKDSVILGGISPHHDGETSTETMLSYTQLNYSETLLRYFDSYASQPKEDFETATGESMPVAMTGTPINTHLSPMVPAGDSTENTEMTSSGESLAAPAKAIANQSVSLTETIMTKHNKEMEKELVKKHREPRFSSRTERDIAMVENRRKKKDHLARCNASYQPTSPDAGDAADQKTVDDSTKPVKVAQSRGLKRPNRMDTCVVQQKNHCPSPRQHRPRKPTPPPTSSQPGPTFNWEPQYQARINNQNMQMCHAGGPDPMAPLLFYMPTSVDVDLLHQHSIPNFTLQSVKYMDPERSLTPSQAYLPERSFPVPQSLMTTIIQTGTPPKKSSTGNSASLRAYISTTVEGVSEEDQRKAQVASSNADRTDGSNSSFYSSSFFKTESGSAEDNSDTKSKSKSKKEVKSPPPSSSANEPYKFQKVVRRTLLPPWMDQVCVTSELIYKYQVVTKSAEEALEDDKKKMLALDQPCLVNDQLGQLYMDLQLEGVAARLTLEEGVTSSGSSAEDSPSPFQANDTVKKVPRKKRLYSKLAMIYEENAPLPSSEEEFSCTSTDLN